MQRTAASSFRRTNLHSSAWMYRERGTNDLSSLRTSTSSSAPPGDMFIFVPENKIAIVRPEGHQCRSGTISFILNGDTVEEQRKVDRVRLVPEDIRFLVHQIYPQRGTAQISFVKNNHVLALWVQEEFTPPNADAAARCPTRRARARP